MDATNIRSTFVRKRGNNFNVYIEYIDEKGNIKQKSIEKYTNKKDAEKHLIELKNTINRQGLNIKTMSFVDRYKQYIYDESKMLSPATVSVRESLLSASIEPFFSDTKLIDVTPSMVQL